ncbi:ABC transporter related [Elusimicrobium minutum Pei191]|uniref:ABC transporter related n=1 Tax=Elusimicrobium minutum (strain Pei191) TaxID=445932 RepID=B2KDY3_ELUMP|nr:ABC transporter ATP-binding protein [Elusimicrobium minutum]ACC98729.1 ABC transporter related [Elusimicrobium minutum Pei191]
MSLIKFKNLTKVYTLGEIQVHALNDVSLTIESGEFVAIMGPSGSGKSTCMNILGCLDKPTSGSYNLDGIDIVSKSLPDLAAIRNQKIGFVFQGFNLLSRTTALENVELPMIYNKIPPAQMRERAMQALVKVGLANRADHVPSQLSGGQQQRVAIARALVNDAPIIFADEPTGNLDTKTSHEVMTLFSQLNSEFKKTVIVITHENDIAAYAKRVVRFLDGKIVEDHVQTPRTPEGI